MIQRFKNQSAWQEVWSLAAPSSAVFFIVTIANLITIKIVAGLGSDAIAAITTGFRFYNIFNAVLVGLTAGTLALVSRAYGQKNLPQASQLVSASLSFSVVLGLVMSIFMMVASPWLVQWFSLSDNAAELSVTFICWFALSFAPIAAYVVFASGLRAAGDAMSPLIFAALINIFIVLFAYWFTYGGLGIKAYGVKGTGLGTSVGNVLGIVVAFAVWWRGKLRLRPVFNAWRTQLNHIKSVLHLGYPAALEQLIMQVGFLAFLAIVGRYGTPAYAAYGTGLTLLTLTMVVGYGFSIAGSILVGQQLGAKNYVAAKQAGWQAMRYSVVILTTLAVLLLPFVELLAQWLVDDEAVAHYTVLFIYILCLAQPLIGIDMALGGALRGAGDTRFPLISTIAGLLVVRFGLALLFMYWELPVAWVYATVLADYAVKNVLLIYRFRSDRWIAVKLHSSESV